MIALHLMPTVMRHPDPFSADIVAAAKAHAVAEYPRESCGFVTEADGYLPMVNVHPKPEERFRVSPEATKEVMARTKVLALVHSHPDGPNFPSVADQQAQIATGMTWGIVPVIGVTGENGEPVGLASDVLWWGDKLPVAQLEQRKFIWGIFHCWSLARDWYRTEWGLTLPNFAVAPDFYKKGESVFIDNCEKAGLRNLGKVDMSCLQVGDLLVGHAKGDVPNHCGVYLGGDDFLHHPPEGASGKAQLVRWWSYIDTVFRYDGQDVASLRGTS